ncbi:MAG: phthiocerol/phthiodiolone dimycocerosyl transferase family protein [Chitinispirillaceae bacterium]
MKRDTSTYERVMFFNARQKPMYFAFHLKVRGAVGADELRKSLATVRPFYPLSSVRVGFGPGKSHWVTTEGVPEYPVAVLEQNAQWRAVVSEMLIEKWDETKGPMVKFALIPGDEQTELLALFHHAVCDGISALYFLKDLYCVLNGEPVAGLESRGVDRWEPILTEAVTEDVRKEFEESEPPVWLKHKLHLQMEMKPCPEFHFLQPSFDIRSIELDEGETESVARRAKEWDVSVHSYLGAVMLSVFARRFARSTGYERIIQSPLSFRHFLRQEYRETFGIFMGIMKETVDCGPERSLKEIASQIHSGFRRQIDSTEKLMMYLNFMTHMLKEIDDPEAFWYSSPRHDFMDYDFSLSNLGRIDFPDKKRKLLELHGPIFSAVDGERIFGVNTTNGRMAITMIYDSNCFWGEWAEELFGSIEDMLRVKEMAGVGK